MPSVQAVLTNSCLTPHWVGHFRLENVKNQRERRKTAEKGKDEKEQETLKHEKPPPFLGGGLSWPFLTIKLGDFLRFLPQACPPTEVAAKFC